MTVKINKGLEIWFLTGSQSLYGEDTLRQVAEQSQEVARTLDGPSQIPVKIIWKPVLKTLEAIKEIRLSASRSTKCVGAI